MNYPRPSPFSSQLYTAFRDGRDEIHTREKKVERNASSSLVTDDELCFQRERGKGGGVGPTMRCDQRNLILEEEGTVTRPEARCLLL